MSDDLRELYQEIILDHNKSPRNFHGMEDATHQAEGYNPLCGDRYTIFARVEDGVIADVSFEGAGCAISKSSASLMTEAIKGKSVEEADELFKGFVSMLMEGGSSVDHETLKKLRKVALLQGVCAYPTRIKCATLSWHTLHNALEGDEKASTE